MTTAHPSLEEAKQKAEQGIRANGLWIERLARLGYAAKGVVYIIIGFLALAAAFQAGGKLTSTQGAFVTLLHEPFGKFLLGLVAFGLAGYALWRFVQAFFDPENEGSDAKGIVKRVACFISGVGYAIAADGAFNLLMGNPTSNGSQSTQHWTARALTEPFGTWLVGLIGLIIIGVGLGDLWKAYRADFADKLGELNGAQRKWAVESGRWGYAALGVVTIIIGGFFLRAAMNANPQQAKGVGSALALLETQPFGSWLLAVVAAGLVAYGIFMLVEARYRRIAV